jgi:hypothetical protein
VIRIIITDEQGTLLGATTLDMTDLNANGHLPSVYVGDKVKAELPTNTDALKALLA